MPAKSMVGSSTINRTPFAKPRVLSNWVKDFVLESATLSESTTVTAFSETRSANTLARANRSVLRFISRLKLAGFQHKHHATTTPDRRLAITGTCITRTFFGAKVSDHYRQLRLWSSCRHYHVVDWPGKQRLHHELLGRHVWCPIIPRAM